jgi:hypothetical protein
MVERYEVDIPEDETDGKFIRFALAAARHEDVVHLVTYERVVGGRPGQA